MSVLGLRSSGNAIITADGYQRLCAELEHLRTHRRREISGRLRDARQDGGLDDNPALVEEQAQLERQIAVLETRLAAARVVEAPAGGTAGIGTCVRLRELESGELFAYHLVGPLEADLASSRLSIEAPVGRAVVGLRAGFLAIAETPSGRRRFGCWKSRPCDGAGTEIPREQAWHQQRSRKGDRD